MRDLNNEEYIALEIMVDAAGIEAVLMALSDLCGAAATIVAHEQQNASRAKRWATLEGAIGVIVPQARGL